MPPSIKAERRARTLGAVAVPLSTLDQAIALIGPAWNSCLDEKCRRTARAHMAVYASQYPDAAPATLAIQGLRRINVIARASDGKLIVPSDQWSKAYA